MRYKTDLTDPQWDSIKGFFKQGRMGRKRVHCERDIVDGILYVVKTGCQWDMLPNDFPPKSTVFYHFKHWSEDGTWEKTLAALTRLSRLKSGKNASPSYGLVDSKSVVSAHKCDEKGFDGGKKNQGSQTAHCDGYPGSFASCESPRRKSA